MVIMIIMILNINFFLKEKQMDEEPESAGKDSKKILTLNQEKFFKEEDLKYFDEEYYPRPDNFEKYNPDELNYIYDEVRSQKNDIGYILGGLKKRKEKTEEVKSLIVKSTVNHERLKKYLSRLENYVIDNLPYIEGEGIMKGGGFM